MTAVGNLALADWVVHVAVRKTFALAESYRKTGTETSRFGGGSEGVINSASGIVRCFVESSWATLDVEMGGDDAKCRSQSASVTFGITPLEAQAPSRVCSSVAVFAAVWLEFHAIKSSHTSQAGVALWCRTKKDMPRNPTTSGPKKR